MEWLLTAIDLLRLLSTNRKPLDNNVVSSLQMVVMLIEDLLEKKERHCFQKEYKCKYRDGACHILYVVGEKWTMGDVINCPYREETKND